MRKKKLLILGGKPIGSCELVQAAKDLGHYVIVADYLPVDKSPAKRIADESWDISTADIDKLELRCRECSVDGILTGVHDFNIAKMAELTFALGLPCYTSPKLQALCDDKRTCKDLCRSHGIDVAREYSIDEASRLPVEEFPLAVKPRDGSGSRGFTKVDNASELAAAVDHAVEFSMCGEALIEEYVVAEALIAQYTAHNGKVLFCGLTDKYSLPIGEVGAPVMAFQSAPARCTDRFLTEINQNVISLLEELGFAEGPIWIEFFKCGKRFIFNEIGYRFGGSLTYHLVKKLYGIDQLRLLIDYSLGIVSDDAFAKEPKLSFNGSYAIWPVHLKPGKIVRVEGLDWLRRQECFSAMAQVHWVGDVIQPWGSAQQVFAYLHLCGNSLDELMGLSCEILKRVRVIGEDGSNLMFALFDPSVQEFMENAPSFVHGGLSRGVCL